MSKIKLVEYPFLKHQIGDVVDLGEEKNISMVDLGRAVWIDVSNELKPKRTPKKVVPPVALKNELQEQIEQEKKASSKKSFWDSLK